MERAPAPPDTFPIIGMVSSAGGLDAMTRVLAALPHDLAAAFLVVQHHSPDHPSHLAEILSERCRLRIGEAVDGVPLEPRLVLTAPAGQHLLIDSSLRARVVMSGAYPPNRPSADLLLVSLAVAAERRAIAVVLSGGGTDGATGATAIHDFGGTVIASDAESSAHYGMPEATIGRGDAVDHIAHVDDIGELIISIVERAHADAGWPGPLPH